MKRIFFWSLLLTACATVTTPVSTVETESDWSEVRGHYLWAEEGLTPKVILVTVDGLRWQELFRGIDPLILNADREHSGIKDPEALRAKFWREDIKERREALFPNFWEYFDDNGSAFGNRDLESRVSVRNPHWISYPGYAEMITGEVQEAIIENDAVQIPVPTVWEFIRHHLGLPREKVACIASWARFHEIAEHTPGTIVINAGYDTLDPALSTPGMAALNAAQHLMKTPWNDVRHDHVTMNIALEYLKSQKPVAMHIALGETDDWGHERRYDRVIHAAHMFDQFLPRLWESLRADPFYRAQTTVIIAADHGRGVELKTWIRHRPHIPSSETSWIAVMGPGTLPIGEREKGRELYITHVAAMILGALDLDWRKYNPDMQQGVPEAAISWER
jgi:hypothetical protein